MRAWLIFLALAPASFLAAAEVYRWTDANGQTHYTDRPQAGAERLTIVVGRPAGSPDEGATSNGAEYDDGTAPTAGGYTSLTITSPAQEQTLWNIEGQLEVAAAVQPALQPGHTLRFTLDGRSQDAAPGASGTRFPEVFRGEHSVRVDVTDPEGNILVSSPTSRFFVRQNALPPPGPRPKPRPRP